jgi:hypothetical protein
MADLRIAVGGAVLAPPTDAHLAVLEAARPEELSSRVTTDW